MFVLSVHNFKMFDHIRASAEYNRRAAIIESLYAGQTEIIPFFGYLRSIIYDIAAKYLISKTIFKKGSVNPTKKKSWKRLQQLLKGLKSSFHRTQGYLYDEISKNFGCDNCWKGFTFQILIKVIKVRQMLSEAKDEQSCLLYKEFWSPSLNLNPMDYYV